ncbi:MAG: cytochrome c biogenesis protein CcdA [Chloroflexota bacterium]
MENTSFLVAFGAGLLSFVSPCILPVIPVYLGSLCGPEVYQPLTRKIRWSMFLHSLVFVAGFSLIFILLGAVAGLTGFTINLHSRLTRQIAGSLLIIFGLLMIASLKIPWLNYERRLSPSLGTTTGYFRSFLTGSVFCLAWTPCVGPLLGGILALAVNSATAWHGTYLLAIYSLGLGLPFIIAGIAFDVITPVLRRIRSYSTAIYLFSSVLLITMGVLTLLNKLIWL